MKVGELFVVLGTDMSQYDRDLATAQVKVRTAGSAISDIFKNAVSFTAGMAIWEAIQAGFRATVKTALDFNVMMQNARIGFETMLGSAQKAQDFLDQMGKFAAATPFEYPDLLEASRRLMAFGYTADDVLPVVKSVGDAVAAMGGGREQINNIIYALGQMRTAGRLNAQDMMQLTNAGIPAWEMLAEKMGKSVAEVRNLSEQGLIPAAQAVPILIEGMEKRFPNMMEKMQDTWMGVTSTIKDVWRMTIGAVTQSLFQGLNNWLKGVRDWATNFYAAFQQGGLMFAIQKMFGSDVATVVSAAADVFKTLWNILVGIASFIKTHWATLKPILLGVLTAMLYFRTAAILQNVFMRVASGIEMMRYSLKLFIMGLRDIPSIIGKISAALTMLTATNPIFLAITAAIAILVIAGVLLYRNWDKVRYYGLQTWGALKVGILYAAYGIVSAIRFILGWIPFIGGALGRAQSALAGYIANEKAIMTQRASSFAGDTSDITSAKQLVDNQKQIASAGNNAASGLNKQADATKKAGKAAQDNLQSFDEVHQIMQDTAEAAAGAGEAQLPAAEMPEVNMPGIDLGGVAAGLGDFANNTTSIFDTLSQKVGSIWDGIVSKISGAWSSIKNTTATIWNEIVGGLHTAWNWLSGLASGIFGPIGAFIVTTWQNLLATSSAIWNIIWTTLSAIWNNLRATVSTVWGEIWTFISTTWNNLWTTASTVWNLIWSFLTGLWNNIWLTASTIWKAIADLITGKIDLRTAVKIIWDAIVGFFVNTWNSIKNTANGIWSAIAGFITGTWDGLKKTAGDVWGAVEKFFSDTWDNIKKAVEDIWGQIKGFFETTWNNLKTTAQQVWQTIESYIVDPIKRAWEGIKKIVAQLKQDISDAWNSIWATISSWAGNIYNAISQPFIDAKNYIANIIDEAYNWGKNLIQNIIDGIRDKMHALRDAVKESATIVSNYMEYKSPAKEGPGSTADKWAPNLMRMYAEGIISNVGLVRTAVNTVAENLTGMAVTPAPAFAGGSRTGGGFTPAAAAPVINLHIGTLIADDYGLKQLEQKLRNIRIHEDQRLGSDAR